MEPDLSPNLIVFYGGFSTECVKRRFTVYPMLVTMLSVKQWFL